MGSERPGFSLDDDDDGVDITVLSRKKKPAKSPKKSTSEAAPKKVAQKRATNKRIVEVAKESGFTSREPKKMGRPVSSPYQAQFGGRCRPGMKPLFQEISAALKCDDTETLERAIEALLEKEGLKRIKKEFDALRKD